MSEDRPSWEELNAYVDGELDPHESARVARAVATDPAVFARQVAALTRLKAAAADSLEPVELPAVKPSRRRRWTAVAAAAAVVVLVGVGAYLSLWSRPGDQDFLGRAQAAHRTWVDEDDGETSPEVGAGLLLSSLHRLGPEAYVPDLSSNRLSISKVTFLPADGKRKQALHIGYRGTRGCHVTLWVSPAPANLGTRLKEHRDGPLLSFTWRAGSLAYALLASGMDEARLTLIARIVHRATLERLPLDSETRMALHESREKSVPCNA